MYPTGPIAAPIFSATWYALFAASVRAHTSLLLPFDAAWESFFASRSSLLEETREGLVRELSFSVEVAEMFMEDWLPRGEGAAPRFLTMNDIYAELLVASDRAAEVRSSLASVPGHATVHQRARDATRVQSIAQLTNVLLARSVASEEGREISLENVRAFMRRFAQLADVTATSPSGDLVAAICTAWLAEGSGVRKHEFLVPDVELLAAF